MTLKNAIHFLKFSLLFTVRLADLVFTLSLSTLALPQPRLWLHIL